MYHQHAVAVQQRGGPAAGGAGNWPGSPHMLAHRPAYSPSPSAGGGAGFGGGARGGGAGGYRHPRSPIEAASGMAAAAGPSSSAYRAGPASDSPGPAPRDVDSENFAGFGTRRFAQKVAQQAESSAREAWEQREYERQLAQYEEEKRRYEEETRRYEEEKRRYEEDSRRYAEAQRQQAMEDQERRRRYEQEEARARQEEEDRRREEEQERATRRQQQEQQAAVAAARAERQALVERQRNAAKMRDEDEQRRSPMPPSSGSRSPGPPSGSRSPYHHHYRSQTSMASSTTSGSGGSLRGLRGAVAMSAAAEAFEKRPGAPERSGTIDSASSVGLAYDREPSRPQSIVSRQDSVNESTPRAGVEPSSSFPSGGQQPQIQLRRPSAVGLGIDAANQRLPASIRETMYDDDFEEGEEDEGGDTTMRNRYTQYGGHLDADDVTVDASASGSLLAAPALGDAGRSQGRRSMALATVSEPSPMAKCADCGQNIAFELLADHSCAATSSAPPLLSPTTAARSPFFDKYAAVHAGGRSFAASRSHTLDVGRSSSASSTSPSLSPHTLRPRDLDLSASTASTMRSPPARALTSPMPSPALSSSPLPPDASSEDIARAASERRKYIEQQREAARRGQLTPKVGSAGPASPLPALRVDTSVAPVLSQQRSPASVSTPASSSSPAAAVAAAAAKHQKAMSSSSSASSAHSSLLGPSSGAQRRHGGGGGSSASAGPRSPSSAGLTPSSSYDVLSEEELASSASAGKAATKSSAAPSKLTPITAPQRRGSSDSDASSEADLDKLQDLLTDLECSARARAESRASSNRSRSHSSAAGSAKGSRSGSHSGSGSGSISSSHSSHSRSMSRASDATSQPLTVRGAPGSSASRQPSPTDARFRHAASASSSSSSKPKSPVKPTSPSRPVAPVKLCCVCLCSLSSSKLPSVARDGKFFCADDYADLYLPKCRKCQKPVEKNAVKSSDGALTGVFHRECFRCFECGDDFKGEGSSSGSTFYCFGNAPYCATHYHELAGTNCKGCGQGIEGRCRQTEKGERWHPQCLRCQYEGEGEFCQEALDDFFVIDGKRLCEWHVKKTQKAMERAGRARIVKPSKRSTKLFNV